MTAGRISRFTYRSFSVLGALLLVSTLGVALSGTTLVRDWNPIAGWVMVILPSSPWLLYWVVTVVAGLSRWGSMRFILVASSPLLIWQGLQGLGCGSDELVPLTSLLFWTRIQGGLQLALVITALASLVAWRLETRAADAPQ